MSASWRFRNGSTAHRGGLLRHRGLASPRSRCRSCFPLCLLLLLLAYFPTSTFLFFFPSCSSCSSSSLSSSSCSSPSSPSSSSFLLHLLLPPPPHPRLSPLQVLLVDAGPAVLASGSREKPMPRKQVARKGPRSNTSRAKRGCIAPNVLVCLSTPAAMPPGRWRPPHGTSLVAGAPTSPVCLAGGKFLGLPGLPVSVHTFKVGAIALLAIRPANATLPFPAAPNGRHFRHASAEACPRWPSVLPVVVDALDNAPLPSASVASAYALSVCLSLCSASSTGLSSCSLLAESPDDELFSLSSTLISQALVLHPPLVSPLSDRFFTVVRLSPQLVDLDRFELPTLLLSSFHLTTCPPPPPTLSLFSSFFWDLVVSPPLFSNSCS